LFDNLYGILFCVLDVRAEESVLWMDEGSMRSHGQMYCPFLVECGKIRGILCSIAETKGNIGTGILSLTCWNL